MSRQGRLPLLIAFDLDYTLWDLWVDTHVTGNEEWRSGNALNQVLDRHDQEIVFYPDVPKILHQISGEATLALCSRTNAPDYARDVLRLLLIPPPPSSSSSRGSQEPKQALDYFPQKEIYPGSKIKHFKALHKKTGIPYSEMLFYDDEYRNREVESLGVTFVLVPTGVDSRRFWDGVEKWRKEDSVMTSSEEDISMWD